MEITLTFFDEELKQEVEFQAEDGLAIEDYMLLAYNKKTGVENTSLLIADADRGDHTSLKSRFHELKMSNLRKRMGSGSVQLIP